MLKNSLPFKKNTKAVNNSSSSGMKNTEFSEYYFYLKPDIYRNFQIWINVPLKEPVLLLVVFNFFVSTNNFFLTKP